MPANIENYASLKRWAGVLLSCGILLLFVAISRDAARSVTPRIVAAKPTARAVPTIADATAGINQALREIYGALTRGEPTLAAGYLVPNILQNTGVLDFICRPFTYRAHYIEAVAERPDPTGLIFQARVRVLLKPLEERAHTMVFRMVEGRYVMLDVNETGEDWFGPQKEEAADVVRRFLYATKAGENQIARQNVSAHFPFAEFVGNAEVQKRLGWVHEVNITGRRVEQLQGLKFAIVVTFPECFGTIANKRFYLDRIGGQLKIVRAFDQTNLPTLCVWPEAVGDPEIEAYTLKRFGIAPAPPGRGPLMLYLLSILCIGGAVALWLFANKKTIDARSRLPMPADDTVRNHLVALQQEYPQLLSLSLPIAPVEYDGWIEESLKRARMRSWGLTREQEAKLIGQLTALQAGKLAYMETTRKLQQTQRDMQRDKDREAARREQEDRLEEQRYAAEQVELEVKIAEAQDRLDRLKEEKTKRNNPPAVVSQKRDPTMEAIAAAMRKVETITALEEKRDEEKRKHPDLAPLIDREFGKIISDMREQR